MPEVQKLKGLPGAFHGVDAVIHLGAGRCRELPEYLAAEIGRIVLVEANPKVARVLRAQSSDHGNVQVLRRAVSGQGGKAVLNVYNLPERNSLRKATGLLERYPGLRLIEEIPLNVCNVSSILEELELSPGGTISLMIDTPGEEYSILEGMARDNLLQNFYSVALRCPQMPMYEGAAARQDIVNLLDSHGFEISDMAVEDELDTVLVLRLNRWKLENSGLQQQLATVRTELKASRQALFDETSELNVVLSKKDDELRTLTKENRKLKEKNAEQQTAFTQSKEQLGLLQQERDSLQKRLAVLEKKNAGLQEKLVHQKGKVLKRQQQKDSLQKELDQFAKRKKIQETKLAEARRDLGIALRMQALRENDIDQLQQRFSVVVDLTSRQDELLRELRQRLSVAAEYLKKFREDDLAQFDGQLASHLVQALTASGEEKGSDPKRNPE